MTPALAPRAGKLVGAQVLVLGGSSGIGFGVASAALGEGAHVTIASSQKSKVDRAVSRLRAADGAASSTVSGHVCDLSKPMELENNISHLFETVVSTSQRKINHVVLTAGDGVSIKPLTETSVPEMLSTGTVRFLGALVIGKLAPKYLDQSPHSSVTFTGGTMSHRPLPKWTLQAAWGSGIEGATRGLAVDLAPIRVNCVTLGAFRTELFDNVPPDARGAVLQGYCDASLLGSVGNPDEGAESYIYLMRSSFTTGTTVVTDGGRTIK
ncbi:MAG: hypothetical protein Q9222_002712 [Ikaeria aurantiellina]